MLARTNAFVVQHSYRAVGLSPPSAPAYLLAVDRNTQQWVQGNQERHEVEGDTHIKCVVHDSADDKRHEAYLKTKESYKRVTQLIQRVTLLTGHQNCMDVRFQFPVEFLKMDKKHTEKKG